MGAINFIVGIGAIAAWITNFMVAMEKSQHFHLIAGVIPPYGVVRGVLIWFGVAG